MATDLHFPYRFDARGRTRTAPTAVWIRGLVEQVLFTAPGERVMRPDFGSGLGQLVFAPNSPELAATVQALTLGALQQYLAELVSVDDVTVRAGEATLAVTVRYTIRANGESREDTITREAPAP